MSALFSWPEAASKPSPAVGDKRIVTRFLLLPKKLHGEWRWIGFERIQQEFQRYFVSPPEMPSMFVVGWRDVAWADQITGTRVVQSYIVSGQVNACTAEQLAKLSKKTLP